MKNFHQTFLLKFILFLALTNLIFSVKYQNKIKKLDNMSNNMFSFENNTSDDENFPDLNSEINLKVVKVNPKHDSIFYTQGLVKSKLNEIIESGGMYNESTIIQHNFIPTHVTCSGWNNGSLIDSVYGGVGGFPIENLQKE